MPTRTRRRNRLQYNRPLPVETGEESDPDEGVLTTGEFIRNESIDVGLARRFVSATGEGLTA